MLFSSICIQTTQTQGQGDVCIFTVVSRIVADSGNNQKSRKANNTRHFPKAILQANGFNLLTELKHNFAGIL